jgi:hypothetical protein
MITNAKAESAARTSHVYHEAVRLAEAVQRMPSIEVFAIGSPVNIIHANQCGTVTSVCVHACNRVRYEVAWWEGVTRRCEWLEAFEVEAGEKSERSVIGFREE